MASHPDTRKFALIPWGGVASLVLRDDKPAACHPSSEASALVGQAFCFLPLPVTTGLPVHVNGFFELSSNRRDIWWGTDMVGDGRFRAQWNSVLLEDIIAPAYALLLRHAAALFGPQNIEHFYALWPPESRAHESWQVLTRCVYKALCTMPLFFPLRHAAQPGGMANDASCWISAKDAVLLSRDSKSGAAQDCGLLCAQHGVSVVLLPPHVLAPLFLYAGGDLVRFEPAFVRGWLRGKQPLPLQPEQGFKMIGYVLSDSDGKDYSGMDGIPLVSIWTERLDLNLNL
jgi:sacsin